MYYVIRRCLYDLPFARSHSGNHGLLILCFDFMRFDMTGQVPRESLHNVQLAPVYQSVPLFIRFGSW